ncbi:Callose synthase 3, partial [Mucuna pruriens]
RERKSLIGMSSSKESVINNKVVPSSLIEIAPILRVANEYEKNHPRVAYLCRFYAFEGAHTIAFHQFKTALIQRLHREHDPSLKGRVKKSDAGETQSFYPHYYKKYIQALENDADKVHRAQLTKAHQTANVILEALKDVNNTQSMQVDRQILETLDKVAENTEVLVPYNIRPLDPDNANQTTDSEVGMSSLRGGAGPSSEAPPRRIIRTLTAGNLGESVIDSEVVPSSLVEIAPILRVANEVEKTHPRVAFLCMFLFHFPPACYFCYLSKFTVTFADLAGRFYAFEKAHRLDPNSSGRGVRQFKTALLQRLERENDLTLKERVMRSDAHQIHGFYRHYFKNYILASGTPPDKSDRAQLNKAYQTVNILFEVSKAFNMTQSMEVDHKILETEYNISERTEVLVPYNGANQGIMRFPEIEAAVYALRNTRGLPWPEDYKKKKDKDILDWLGLMFGFQKHNVTSQREHLILLLANVHIRQFPKPDQQPMLDERALTEVMDKLFKNYKRWCKLPTTQQEIQQHKLLYMGLYLLIWGDAANLRFMPECLCYIYHHMAFELYGTLAGDVSPLTGENVKPAYGGGEGSFLWKVVTPFYNVIAKEAARSKKGRWKHSQSRNYGWPLRADADFFSRPEKLGFDKCNVGVDY